MTPSPHILIVAGEASGEIHGANLVKAIHEKNPEITFSGMGGHEMSKAGVNILFDAAKIAVVGAVEVISHLKDIFHARKTLIKEMQEKKPALLILIDFPDFNLLLARTAKKLNIPVFYYISPQVWAWRQNRVKKIGKLAKRIGTILPFEQSFYAQYGYNVDFVGHPLLDIVKPQISKNDFLKLHSIPSQNRLIAIIPGSRSKEVQNMLPDFLNAAVLFAGQSDIPCTYLLPRASTIAKEYLLESGLAGVKDKLDIRVIDENRFDLMAACDAAIATSGTVTLELAILEIPAIVAYRVSKHTYRLGRLLVRNVKYFSLINLIAGKQIVPELLQDEVTPQRIVTELTTLLKPEQHETTVKELRNLKTILGGSGASQKAAVIVLEMLGEREK